MQLSDRTRNLGLVIAVSTTLKLWAWLLINLYLRSFLLIFCVFFTNEPLPDEIRLTVELSIYKCCFVDVIYLYRGIIVRLKMIGSYMDFLKFIILAAKISMNDENVILTHRHFKMNQYQHNQRWMLIGEFETSSAYRCGVMHDTGCRLFYRHARWKCKITKHYKHSFLLASFLHDWWLLTQNLHH